MLRSFFFIIDYLFFLTLIPVIVHSPVIRQSFSSWLSQVVVLSSCDAPLSLFALYIVCITLLIHNLDSLKVLYSESRKVIKAFKALGHLIFFKTRLVHRFRPDPDTYLEDTRLTFAKRRLVSTYPEYLSSILVLWMVTTPLHSHSTMLATIETGFFAMMVLSEYFLPIQTLIHHAHIGYKVSLIWTFVYVLFPLRVSYLFSTISRQFHTVVNYLLPLMLMLPFKDFSFRSIPSLPLFAEKAVRSVDQDP